VAQRALSGSAFVFVCLSAMCGPAQERIWTDIARHVVELGQVEGHEGAVYSLAWSPDGTRLASGSGRDEARTGDSPIRVRGVR